MTAGTLLAVGIASATGGLLRYFISRLPLASGDLPVTTFLINISGAFVLGVVATFFAERFEVDSWLRAALTIGFLGSYTTFSTFSFESWALIEGGAYGLAIAYSAGSLIAGIAATYAGVMLGRALA